MSACLHWKARKTLFILLQKPVIFRQLAARFYSMDISEVVQRIVSLAPLNLAEKWDNVGLLIEPSSPHVVKKLLLTNDLTLPVMQEAVTLKADMIVSYHPPIFRPLKKLCQNDVKEKIAVQCVENRIAVFSPHTSFDAAVDGVNDWLISAFG